MTDKPNLTPTEMADRLVDMPPRPAPKPMRFAAPPRYRHGAPVVLVIAALIALALIALALIVVAAGRIEANLLARGIEGMIDQPAHEAQPTTPDAATGDKQ